MVPVTAGQGDKVLGKIEVTSPVEQMSEFFAGIDKSLINLVDFAKKSLNLEEKDAQRESLQRQIQMISQQLKVIIKVCLIL